MFRIPGTYKYGGFAAVMLFWKDGMEGERESVLFSMPGLALVSWLVWAIFLKPRGHDPMDVIEL